MTFVTLVPKVPSQMWSNVHLQSQHTLILKERQEEQSGESTVFGKLLLCREYYLYQSHCYTYKLICLEHVQLQEEVLRMTAKEVTIVS